MGSIYNPAPSVGTTVETSEITFPISPTSAAATTDVFTSKVTGDSQNRFVLNGDGRLEWGPGNAALDSSFWRSGAGFFTSNSSLSLEGELRANGLRPAIAGNGLWSSTGELQLTSTANGRIEATEQSSAPAAPEANKCRVYAQDNGSGKTKLMVRFATGEPIQLAIEP